MNTETVETLLSMNNQDIYGASGWRPMVEIAIIDFLVNNPSSSIEFRTRDIHTNYGNWLQDIFPDNTRIEATTNAALSDLVDVHNQIERIETGRYKLIVGERLYLRVELHKCQRKLQAITEILSSP